MRIKLLFSFFVFVLFFSFGVSDSHAASYALSPSSGSLNVSCMSTIDIILDTQGAESNAVDMFLNFNPAEIEFIDQDLQKDGVQVKEGGVFSVYAANTVLPGQVRMTAFNLVGSFSGSGVFATLAFNVKPGVTSSSLNFDFAPGETTDSNVADMNAEDVLSAVYNGSYSFSYESCNPDVQAPQVSQIVPSNGSRDVPLSSTISFKITDNQSGVDLEYLQVQVGVEMYDRTSPSLRTLGVPLEYAVEVDPVVDFPQEEGITIIVRAQDINGNVMSPRVFSYNMPIPPPPPPPEPICGNKVVEEGEGCEPPNTVSCNESCQPDILGCLEVDPVLMLTLAEEASETGELSPEKLAAISSMENLIRVIQGPTQIVNGEQGSLVGGYFTNSTVVERTVEVLTNTTQTIVESIGCTEDCVKYIFGPSNEYWYIPSGVLACFGLLLVFLIYLMWKRRRR